MPLHRLKFPIAVLLTLPTTVVLLICLSLAEKLKNIEADMSELMFVVCYFLSAIILVGILISIYISRKKLDLINIVQTINEKKEVRQIKNSCISEFNALIEALNLASSDLMNYHSKLNRDKQILKRKALSILYAATDAIIGIDRQQKIRIWNPSATRIFGYESKDAIGRNINDIVLNDDSLRERHKVLIENAFARIEKSEPVKRMIGNIIAKVEEFDTINRNGENICVSITIIFVDNMFVGFVHDITEQKKAKLQQQNYLARVEALVREKTKKIYELNSALIQLNLNNLKLTEQISRTKHIRNKNEY